MMKRSKLIFAALAGLGSLLAAPAAFAQYASTGDRNFSLERWDEDYSDLKDSVAPDPFDRLKYVPLDKDGHAWASFGGQARYRYDYFNNRSFGPGSNDEDGFHLQRYLVHADLHLDPHFRAFVQLNSGFLDGRVGGPRYGDADDFDLQQAFVDLKTSGDANPYAFLRVGRQELIYGAQRFISPDDWRNVRRSFDGAKVSISVPNDTFDVFWVRPVIIEQDQFNNGDSNTSFAGIYNVLEMPGVLTEARSKFETYFLALNQTQNAPAGGDADTYTAGARFHTHPGALDVDVEGNYQFGDVGGESLSAWSIASEGGYTFESLAWTPRAAVGFDIASGSPDRGGRFNQLFPPTYLYLGHAYLFGRTNLIDAHVAVDFHLTPAITLFTAQHVYWRQNTNDALYNLSGVAVRADSGSAAAFAGNEFDVVINWQINQNLDAYMGYAHFTAGDFLQETGAAEDVDFLYAAVTITF